MFYSDMQMIGPLFSLTFFNNIAVLIETRTVHLDFDVSEKEEKEIDMYNHDCLIGTYIFHVIFFKLHYLYILN